MSLFKLCWTDSRESSGPKPQMSILLSYLKTRMYVVRMYSLRTICVQIYTLCELCMMGVEFPKDE